MVNLYKNLLASTEILAQDQTANRLIKINDPKIKTVVK